MDKQLLKAYIRTIVEEEVKRLLPEMLAEAVTEIKQLKENSVPQAQVQSKPKLDRSKLAAMMGLSVQGDTIMATTQNMPIVANAPKDVDPEVVSAINRDYSALMKKMGLT